MQKILFLVLVATFSVTSVFAQNKKEAASKDKMLIQKQDVFYVDVRTAAEFAEGSVKNAVNIPLDQIENNLGQFKDKKKIVVFCKSGTRSAKAKSILEKNQILNVTNGGSWQEVTASVKK